LFFLSYGLVLVLVLVYRTLIERISLLGRSCDQLLLNLRKQILF
jgi:hypothetical protein